MTWFTTWDREPVLFSVSRNGLNPGIGDQSLAQSVEVGRILATWSIPWANLDPWSIPKDIQ